MMQLADRKKCFLLELDAIPSEEVSLWVAYYDEVDLRQKQAEQRAKIEASLNAKAH